MTDILEVGPETMNAILQNKDSMFPTEYKELYASSVPDLGKPTNPKDRAAEDRIDQIGRASCRERV